MMFRHGSIIALPLLSNLRPQAVPSTQRSPGAVGRGRTKKTVPPPDNSHVRTHTTVHRPTITQYDTCIQQCGVLNSGGMCQTKMVALFRAKALMRTGLLRRSPLVPRDFTGIIEGIGTMQPALSGDPHHKVAVS